MNNIINFDSYIELLATTQYKNICCC